MSAPELSRRRSQRVVVGVGITVSSENGPGFVEFQENTKTLVVNAHGSLIELAARVVKGQLLLLTNRATGEQQACHVVHIGTASAGKNQIAVEFTSKAPDFWRIAFPPEDWGVNEAVSSGRMGD